MHNAPPTPFTDPFHRPLSPTPFTDPFQYRSRLVCADCVALLLLYFAREREGNCVEPEYLLDLVKVLRLQPYKTSMKALYFLDSFFVWQVMFILSWYIGK